MELKEYVDLRFAENQRAVALAHMEITRRIDELNHLHKLLISERDAFVVRSYYDQEHAALRDRIDGITRLVWMATGAVTVFGLVIQVVLFVVRYTEVGH